LGLLAVGQSAVCLVEEEWEEVFRAKWMGSQNPATWLYES